MSAVFQRKMENIPNIVIDFKSPISMTKDCTGLHFTDGLCRFRKQKLDAYCSSVSWELDKD